MWLKNLPPLKHTNIVDLGEFIEFKSGKKIAKWYSDGLLKQNQLKSVKFGGVKHFQGLQRRWQSSGGSL
ncbi:hypothetical protein HMPREF1423_00292 [Helicobacter pylori GAM270ASi]|nr:hypothetical protein HMPREF1423_00292 [Helicobacter pylori GAM270ASi]